jgi:putative membrane protein
MNFKKHNIEPFCWQIPEKKIIWFFLIFYFVGLLLFSFEASRSWFFLITPLSLLLVTALMLCFHRGFRPKTILAFALVFVISFLVEFAGVNTGKLFGNYMYLSALGPKIGNVPLLIGVNWILLVYSSNSIMTYFTHHPVLKIAGAAGLMVLYDIVLEMAAPVMQMWSFHGSFPPLKNFLVWLVLALFFHGLFYIMKVETKNRPARWLFLIQFVFFLLILITENLLR